MEIDLTSFNSLNVTDTCAAWNVLSSRLLFSVASESGCHFCMTAFVEYECLIKPRTQPNSFDIRLRERLEKARERGQLRSFPLDLEDLAEVEILEKRKNLGRGELSSIAFAKRTRQAFLTDDQSARKLASQVLGASQVQTTPHLVGWLFYRGQLSDQDKDILIKEHSAHGRPLKHFFEEVYSKAMQYRLYST